jgi:hypothetical protein
MKFLKAKKNISKSRDTVPRKNSSINTDFVALASAGGGVELSPALAADRRTATPAAALFS